MAKFLVLGLDFYEERAILLGRLGHHEQALAIYTHLLKDIDKALEYCHQNYSTNNTHNEDVSLLHRLH